MQNRKVIENSLKTKVWARIVRHEQTTHGINIWLVFHVMQLQKIDGTCEWCFVVVVIVGERFDVHKVILVSCSDYFRSMFTSGMKESNQREIELKGVTSKGLEKVIEVIYTSTTTLDGDDIFDVIGAATHMQVRDILLHVVRWQHCYMFCQ